MFPINSGSLSLILKASLIISWFILFRWCGREKTDKKKKNNKLQRKSDMMAMVAKNVSVNKIVVGKETNQGVEHVCGKRGLVNSGH